MSKKRRDKRPSPPKFDSTPAPGPTAVVLTEQEQYQHACHLAVEHHHDQARARLTELQNSVTDSKLAALVRNDLAVLAALSGDHDGARTGFLDALALHSDCAPAHANLNILDEPSPACPPASDLLSPERSISPTVSVKVAILSFLFNWPSTGGGIVHTVELARFLSRAGYTIRHFYAKHLSWGIGHVEHCPLSSEVLDFSDTDWNITTIQRRFRQAVDSFAPDCVLITDCWNFKPHLAQAMGGYPTFLRFQALECLCPLNNVRLLSDGPGRFTQCPKHQFATPDECRRCLQERGQHSGGLHQADRVLAGVGTPAYDALLRQSLAEVEAVLVLNPYTEAILSPYARRVAVVPWGMDPARFPWPWPGAFPANPDRPVVIFQAGLPDEPMKGFHVLHAACERLRRKRQDFQLVVTGTPAGRVDAFTHFTGWHSQEDLPQLYHASDIVAVPTIAQEGLSRTSVEAMACGKAVVASRIGGLPSTVVDGATGLLCAPGDVAELASKLDRLLDDRALCQQMGLAGRRRFEEDFTWEVVIERHYRRLLVPK